MLLLCLLMDLVETQHSWLHPLPGAAAVASSPLPQPNSIWILSCMQSRAGPPPWGILGNGQEELHRHLSIHVPISAPSPSCQLPARQPTVSPSQGNDTAVMRSLPPARSGDGGCREGSHCPCPGTATSAPASIPRAVLPLIAVAEIPA